MEQFGILFVCTGNICRSPTADAILRHKIRELGLEDRIRVDSAGTHAYHIGDAPDPRSVAMALGRGIDMRNLRARKVDPWDFHEFDWIIAMDAGHHQSLDRIAIPGSRGKIIRFLEFLGRPQGDVPDPYYGAGDGFTRVFDMIEQGCEAMLDRLRREGRIG